MNKTRKFKASDYEQLVKVGQKYPHAEDVQELLAQALALKLDWDGLVDLYLKQSPEKRDHDKLVDAYLKAHRYDEAWEYLQTVIAKQGRTAERQWLEAFAAYLSDRNEEAARILSTMSLDVPPTRKMQILLLRGQLAMRMEDWKEAERWLRQAVELAPGNTSAATIYSQTLRHLGRDEEAIVIEARATKLHEEEDKQLSTTFLMGIWTNNLEKSWAKKDLDQCLKIIDQMEPHADANLKKVLDGYRHSIARIRGN